MTRFDVLKMVEACGIVAILRSPSGDVVEITGALRQAGIQAVEITIDTPGALRMIEGLRESFDDIAIGVGTVLDPQTAREALSAGAQFIVTPTLNVKTIEVANRYDRLIIPGAYTPTEILTALEAGALTAKVFPAAVLGPEYIRHVRAPLPQIPLIPTGGITLDNVPEFIRAGAAAVGIGNSLIGRDAGDPAHIAEHARRYVDAVAQARQR